MTNQVKHVCRTAVQNPDKIHRGADSAVIATFVIEILRAGVIVAAPTMTIYLALYVIALVRS